MLRTHKIAVYLDQNNQWRWRRVAGNGEIIAESGEGYVDRRDCLSALVATNKDPYDLEVQGDEATRTYLEATPLVTPVPDGEARHD